MLMAEDFIARTLLKFFYNMMIWEREIQEVVIKEQSANALLAISPVTEAMGQGDCGQVADGLVWSGNVVQHPSAMGNMSVFGFDPCHGVME